MSTTICKFIKPRTSLCGFLMRYVNFCDTKISEKNVEEVKIPVPWGHIAGKLWGSKDKQPITCLHGLQDNANSFDTLIPMLSSEFFYLAIDLPGHGHSSHLPNGVFYRYYEAPLTIRRIQRYFNWNKISFIGHSYGGICSFLYSSLFPGDVNFFVAIDAIKPMDRNIEGEIKNATRTIEGMLARENCSASDGAEYTKDALIKLLGESSNHSLTEKSSQILLERGAKENNGLFKLSLDSRIKNNYLANFSQSQCLILARLVNCDVLYIKPLDSPYSGKEQLVTDFLNVVKENVKYFEEHKLPGTRYLHLNNPATIAPVINAFITKHRVEK